MKTITKIYITAIAFVVAAIVNGVVLHASQDTLKEIAASACRADWHDCRDNAELVWAHAFFGAGIRSACKSEAQKRATYGDCNV